MVLDSVTSGITELWPREREFWNGRFCVRGQLALFCLRLRSSKLGPNRIFSAFIRTSHNVYLHKQMMFVAEHRSLEVEGEVGKEVLELGRIRLGRARW